MADAENAVVWLVAPWFALWRVCCAAQLYVSAPIVRRPVTPSDQDFSPDCALTA